MFEQRLAGPLAMRSSRWTHPVGRARCQVTNPNLQSGLVTTIEDYGRFLTMIASGGIFEGRRILSRRTVDEMTRLQTGSAELVMPAGRAAENVAGYGLGAWCERALPDGRCTLLSSPGALGAYPWIDRESGAYGVFFMQRRFPYVARSLTEAREAAIAAVAQHYDSTPSDHPPDADRTQAGRLISQRAEK
nr:serine hydrolase [Brevundimonas denitrificans]